MKVTGVPGCDDKSRILPIGSSTKSNKKWIFFSVEGAQYLLNVYGGGALRGGASGEGGWSTHVILMIMMLRA